VNNWSTDMSAAPKGRLVERVIKIKGKPVKRQDVVRDRVWAAGSNGLVTSSHWIDEWGRWEMFNAETPPFAWRPYDPDEFLTVDEDGKKTRTRPAYPNELLGIAK